MGSECVKRVVSVCCEERAGFQVRRQCGRMDVEECRAERHSKAPYILA